MLRLIVASLSLMIILPVVAHDWQQAEVTPEQKRWINGLTDKHGKGCCASADGINPEGTNWNMAGDHYEVKIEGTWYVVPNDKVITEPNRLGYAHVWYYTDNGQVRIRCFLPGSKG